MLSRRCSARERESRAARNEQVTSGMPTGRLGSPTFFACDRYAPSDHRESSGFSGAVSGVFPRMRSIPITATAQR